MRVIYVTKYNIHLRVLKGGELASKSNYEALVKIFGKSSIEILKIVERESVIGKYYQFIYKRDGYDKSEEIRLCQYISSKKADVIFFDGSWFGNLINKINTKGKIIVFLHNVEKQYSLDRMKSNILTFIKYLSVSFNERQIIEKADYVFALNERDNMLIKKYYKRECDLFLPITFQDSYIPMDVADKTKIEKNLLFVGSYFRPNVEGIRWFVKEVLPNVSYRLIIVGRGMEKLKYLESEIVSVVGTVDNMESYYVQADAVIMPIFSGGGMKVKTAEAMMYGKKILGTHEALTGYMKEKVCGIYECNNADEYINVIKNIDNIKFNRNIRDYFLHNFSDNIKEKKLREFIEEYVQ